MSFADDIAAFRDKAIKSMSDNTNKVVEDLFTMAVVLSPSPSNPGPYATGLLVNQWYPSIGEYSSEFSLATSSTGEDSISRIKALSSEDAFFGKDNVVYLANNSEEAYYADKLGWAKGTNNGWQWTGNATAYQMTAQAVQYIQGAYT